jgi:hypothetical protein
MKVSFNKIDLPFTKENLVAVLEEGRKEREGEISDKMIVDWCYGFYLSYSSYCDERSDLFSDDLAKSIAIDVSSQWEADLTNSIGRVLSMEQFQEWIKSLESSNA